MNSYVVALLLTPLALACQLALTAGLGLTSQPFFILLCGAAMAAAWLGGFRAGLASLLLGSLALVFLFIQPLYSFRIERIDDLVSLVLYVAVGLFGSWLCEKVHDKRSQLVAVAEEPTWQARYSAAVESSGSVAYECDYRSHRTAFAGDTIGLVGLPVSQMPSDLEAFVDLVHPDDQHAFKEAVERTETTGKRFSMQYRLRRQDATYAVVQDEGKVIASEQGRPTLIVGLLKDVTEQRRQAEERERATSILKAFVEAAPVGICVLDADMRYLHINQELADMNGFSIDHHLGKTVKEIVPELVDSVEPWFRQVMNTGQPILDHVLVGETPKAPGMQTTWRESWFPVKDASGTVEQVGIIVRDVTEQRLAEEGLRASEERFRLAAEAVNGIIYDYNLLTGHVERTRGLYEVLGYYPDQVPPTAAWWSEQMHPEDRERLQKAELHYNGALRFTTHYRVRHKDGRWLHVEDRAVAVHEGEKLVRVVGCTVDVSERRRAEEALRQSEAEYRSLFDGAGVGNAEFELETGKFVRVNRKYCEMVGYSASELLAGLTMFDITHAEDRSSCLPHFSSRPPENVVRVENEKRYVRKDGEVIWVHWTATLLRGAEGEPLRLLGSATDITARKEAEFAEQERNRRLAVLARTSKLLLLDQLPQRELLASVFREIAHLLGSEIVFHYRLANEPDTLRLHLTEGVPEVDQARFATLRFGELLCGRVAESKTRLVIEDLQKSDHPGSEVLASAGATSYAGFPLVSGGRLLGTVAFVSHLRKYFQPGDVDVIQTACDMLAVSLDRAELLAKFRQAEGQLRLVLEVAGLGVNQIDYTTNTVIPDATCASLFGLTPWEPVSRSKIHELFHPDDREKIIQAMDDCLAPTSNGTFVMEHRILLSDGATRWLSVKKQVTFAGEGQDRKPLSGVLAALDITARKQVEEKLKAADRRKDEFLATLAHELRNPLAPIRTGLQLVQMANGDTTTIDQSCAMMSRQVSQMVHLVDDLMDVSRINRGTIELKREHVPLVAVVNSAVETSRHLIEQMGHYLSVHLPDEPVILDADPTRLAQVFMNLLNNAAKYTDHGGQIALSVERQGNVMIARVTDTGIGIPTNKLKRVFEMFSQVEGALSRSQGGLGIGLCLVKQLVELHGGSIDAHSEGPGKGAQFIVQLPVIVDASEKDASDSAPEAPQSALRILVVDDNRDGANSLSMLLKLMGNETRTAYDGREALAIAEAFRPKVLLLDIGLPDLNGYEACRCIREQSWGKDAVIIALTGWGSEEDRQKTRAAGFDHHMVKPVNSQTLMHLLAEMNGQNGRGIA